MGNRAVIQMQGQGAGIYLHNNGGYDTIAPLLHVAKEYGIRGDDYGIARLAQMLGNFFGGVLSIGVAPLENLDMDNLDNGTYVIDEKFNIVDRLFFDGVEQNVHPFEEMVLEFRAANDKFFVQRKIQGEPNFPYSDTNPSNRFPRKNKWDGHYPEASYCVCTGCVDSGYTNASADRPALR